MNRSTQPTAMCLDYQTVYCRRRQIIISVKLQLLAATFLLASLAAKVWIKVESTDLGYQLAKAREQTVELDMQRRELELGLSVLKRPDNLARAGRERLGFRPLNPGQARKIKFSTSFE